MKLVGGSPTWWAFAAYGSGLSESNFLVLTFDGIALTVLYLRLPTCKVRQKYRILIHVYVLDKHSGDVKLRPNAAR